MRNLILVSTLLLTLTACSNRKKPVENNLASNRYAHGFHIDKEQGIQKLVVFNPWEKANNVSVEYYLLPKGEPLPVRLKEKRVIRTPVKRVICLSTTHLAFLEALEETGAVAGVSGSHFISGKEIRRKIEEGEIPDVGYGENLDYEQIVSQDPDLVMMYGVGSEVTGYAQKLEELGIPAVLIGEYLEEKPLGKAEWIKFAGVLFGKENMAETFFAKVEREYLQLKKMAASWPDKPNVMVGAPFKDTWWVPGGNSYMANLIADAGGHYLGEGNSSNESYIISFEHALAWGEQAAIWINTGNFSSKKEMLSADERFSNFRVFKHGRIFNNIKRRSRHGGNDFWESGTVYPHLILKDLISVFYGEPGEAELFFYREVK